MFKILIYGIFIVLVNVILQAIFSIYCIRKVKKIKNFTNFNIVLNVFTIIIIFTVLHFLQAITWALSYYFNSEISNNFKNFEEIVYFSIVTFSTLGYGDIVLKNSYRILSGIEAINGIMMLSFSTATIIIILQNIYKKINY